MKRKKYNGLTKRQLEILHLYHVCGWTQKRIADYLKTTQQNISEIIVRAGKKLKYLDGITGTREQLKRVLRYDPERADHRTKAQF